HGRVELSGCPARAFPSRELAVNVGAVFLASRHVNRAQYAAPGLTRLKRERVCGECRLVAKALQGGKRMLASFPIGAIDERVEQVAFVDELDDDAVGLDAAYLIAIGAAGDSGV